jgi:hypothetical protein
VDSGFEDSGVRLIRKLTAAKSENNDHDWRKVIQQWSQGGTTTTSTEGGTTSTTQSGAGLGLHATHHQSGGIDPIKLDDLATPDDNTDLNVSTSRHGLVPKISGSDDYVLTKSGSAAVWAAPTGGGSPSGGGDVVAVGTLTDDTVILGDGGTSVKSLANGSNGDVLTLVGGVPAWDAPTGGGSPGGSSGLVLLEQHTASASASLDFTSCISSTFDEYQIEFINIVPSTDGALLWMRVSTNGGSSYDSGANYSFRYWRFAGGSVAAAGSGDTKIVLTEAIDDNALWGVVGSLKLYNPLSTSIRTIVNGQLAFQQTLAGGLEQSLPFGVYDSTTAVDAFQFLMHTGTITSGTIRVYGLDK